mmetsp:Transcript_23120/g.37379  ORF Transcript_23120/g.37379 Transcript_23120/m.37379 type:complete len:104 (+) Transcript_23120:13-324(+)
MPCMIFFGSLCAADKEHSILLNVVQSVPSFIYICMMMMMSIYILYIYINIAEISQEGPGSNKIIFFIFGFLHLTDFSQISKKSFLVQFSSPGYPKCKPSTSII